MCGCVCGHIVNTSNPSMQGLIVCFAIRISNSAAQSPILIKHNFVPISSAICPLAFKTFCLKAVIDPYSWLYIYCINIYNCAIATGIG